MRTLFMRTFLFMWILAWTILHVVIELLPNSPPLVAIAVVSAMAGLSVGAMRRYGREALSRLSNVGRQLPLEYLAAILVGATSLIALFGVGWLFVLTDAPVDEAPRLNSLFMSFWFIPSLSMIAPMCWVATLMSQKFALFIERD